MGIAAIFAVQQAICSACSLFRLANLIPVLSDLRRRPTFILTIDPEIEDLDFGVLRSQNVFYISTVNIAAKLYSCGDRDPDYFFGLPAQLTSYHERELELYFCIRDHCRIIQHGNVARRTSQSHLTLRPYYLGKIPRL
ncbi:hypothetical protein NEUTE1DRAFT_99949 [Neurospora tetrasperma FGSC 2508]|uniref:Uncharacterized protein n=1 Tax=Neurospora tetrasperma (strain FGSC 2508 / ATCC MYA-4615 / P0657) TaxID=510951 RepID=F8MIJ4_NEUT8|nr:uncharacterized protein NEUTE1DRAFT_99949 [Neurospora tetrasperma FGSC 2508]EGO59795.1 hypothetical protein NEUTE1DRAFT_99949 [Neurospora tetrasperma FGSC 2508]